MSKVARGDSFPLQTSLEGEFKALTLSRPSPIALARTPAPPAQWDDPTERPQPGTASGPPQDLPRGPAAGAQVRGHHARPRRPPLRVEGHTEPPRPKTLAREPNTDQQTPTGSRSPPQNMPPGPGSGPPRSANPIQAPAARRSVARPPPSTPPEDRARGTHRRPWQPLARTKTARRLPAAMRARKPVTLADSLGSRRRQ